MAQHLESDDDESRMEYDENSDNGLIMCNKYIPEEIISQLLVIYVDYKSLVNCQVVCKHWKNLINDYVWRKKAESIVGQSLKSIKDLSWIVNYQICHKKLFDENLIKNHSGNDGFKNWKIIQQGGDKWFVEKPPAGVPELPKEVQLDDNPSCFVTSFYPCKKCQVINLVAEGFLPELLDKCQPSIQISEWYSCRWDCPAIYKCSVFLLGEQENILDEYIFEDNLIEEKQFVWLHVSHEFKNYGPGLRKILFEHEGRDSNFWAGHYGSKMSGASVIIKIPQGNN